MKVLTPTETNVAVVSLIDLSRQLFYTSELANPVAWEEKATVEQATVKKVETKFTKFTLLIFSENIRCSHRNFSCPIGATRIRKLVAPMKLLVAQTSQQVGSH